MIDPVILAISTERRVLRARLDALDDIERQIKRTPRPNGIAVVQPRTPPGELRRVILNALTGAGALMSSEIKKRVRENGHSHPLNSQYFTRVLRGLVDEKRLIKKANAAYSTYRLAR